MDGGISLQLYGQLMNILLGPDTIEQFGGETQEEGYAAVISDENGSIIFNMDWMQRQSEMRREALKAFLLEHFPDAELPSGKTLDDLIFFARNHKDFGEFRRHTEQFWQQVTQMSERHMLANTKQEVVHQKLHDQQTQPQQQTQTQPHILKRTSSRFEQLLAKMQDKNMSLRQFVQTLPQAERAVFKANYQIRQTFGQNILNDDGVTLNPTGTLRLVEVSAKLGRTTAQNNANVPNQTAAANLISTTTAQMPATVAKAPLSNGEAARAAAIYTSSAPAAKTGGNAAPQTANQTANQTGAPQNANTFATGHTVAHPNTSAALPNQPLPAVAPLVAPEEAAKLAPEIAKTIVQENVSTNRATHASSAENNANAANILRENGMALGGALISGALSAMENHQSEEHLRVSGQSAADSDVFVEAEVFEAGVTGAMFGAAIGKIIPAAGTDVSGVLGFVSSVVVGVEPDQGMLWLTTTTPLLTEATEIPAQNYFGNDNSFASDLFLQPVLA